MEQFLYKVSAPRSDMVFLSEYILAYLRLGEQYNSI